MPDFRQVRRDIAAGLLAGIIGIPICLAAGILVTASLGPSAVAEGAAAGLYGAVLAGGIAALVAKSSFVVTCPRVSPSLVVAGFLTTIMTVPGFQNSHALLFAAGGVCVMLGGLWQLLFAVMKISSLLKFTPHPVLAGFMNGAALLVIKAQLPPLPAQLFEIGLPEAWAESLLLTLSVAVIAVAYPRASSALGLPAWLQKAPGIIIAFLIGVATYHLARLLAPSLDFGPTVGAPSVKVHALVWHDWTTLDLLALWNIRGSLFLSSLALAVVATLETFMALRASQNAGDISVAPVRDLAAQGCGNCVASILTFTPSAATPSLSLVSYRAGGRTRVVGISCSIVILLLGLVFSDFLVALPTSVLSGILVALGILMFDSWSLGTARKLLWGEAPLGFRRTGFDMLVVVAVMLATIFGSVVIGVAAGCIFAMLIFVVDMSKPIVRRQLEGDQILSKRVRSQEEIASLVTTGANRVVLQLEGVLFFGNAEDLASRIKHLLDTSKTIILDFRKVTDIDITGATILASSVRKAGQTGKTIYFCQIPDGIRASVLSLFEDARHAANAIMPDVDMALERAEQSDLQALYRGQNADLALNQVNVLAEMPLDQIEELRSYLALRRYEGGDILCQQGSSGDRMWLLLSGSVSVRLGSSTSAHQRRLVGLGCGTIVGEMALIEGTSRSANIIADEAVVCYELTADAFHRLLQERPALAELFMRNCARELSRRLRRTSAELQLALD